MVNEIFAFAFMVGAITTVNPCGFALLPAYLARRLATDASARPGSVNVVGKAIAVGTVTTLGFVLIFGAAAAAISFGAAWLIRVLPWAGLVIGLALVCVGILVLAGRHISLDFTFLKASPIAEQKDRLTGDFLFGAAYGASSLSCTLPVLLGITGTAMTGSVISSTANFIAFALGMGTVFTALAVGAALSRDGLARRSKRVLPYINRVSGALVMAAGLYVTYYWGFALFDPNIPGGFSVIIAGERLSGTFRAWIGSDIGEKIIVGVFVLMVLTLAWSLWRRIVPRRDGSEIKPAA